MPLETITDPEMGLNIRSFSPEVERPIESDLDQVLEEHWPKIIEAIESGIRSRYYTQAVEYLNILRVLAPDKYALIEKEDFTWAGLRRIFFGELRALVSAYHAAEAMGLAARLKSMYPEEFDLEIDEADWKRILAYREDNPGFWEDILDYMAIAFPAKLEELVANDQTYVSRVRAEYERQLSLCEQTRDPNDNSTFYVARRGASLRIRSHEEYIDSPRELILERIGSGMRSGSGMDQAFRLAYMYKLVNSRIKIDDKGLHVISPTAKDFTQSSSLPEEREY